ncbi:MAG: FAD-dependent oxidoreductase, partial [Planctomycetota bacterium]|nr:FAD-dependent oxidoreductase [Planctomycetota bacterium]
MSVRGNPTKTILEPPKETPVVAEADVCVVGGSCTGVFAAVRAARLGASVVLIEKQNCFGGTATSGLVNIWHSLHDIDHKQKIIGGLTEEMLQRLRRRDAVIESPADEQMAYKLDTEELKFELDRLVLDEKRINPLLHTLYACPILEDGHLQGVIVESKSGRGAILARTFVDASGDGDLAAHCGVPFAIHETRQPPSTCAKIWDMPDLKKCNWQAMIEEHGEEFSLKSGFPWFAEIPGVPGAVMVAASRVFGANCADVRQLTEAEFEGRRQIRATIDLVRKYGPRENNPRVLAISSHIGIRETRRFECRHHLSEEEVLEGVRFDDAIANGTYRVDVHHSDHTGITFKYLDGRQEFAREG